MSELERTLGYQFTNKALLEEALTRPGLARTRSGLPFNYQRLEFLGDSVLGIIVAEMLFALYPSESEGDLARRHSALVRAEALSQIAADIDLASHMPGAKDGTGVADACEALLGALFLDGGLQAAEAFIRPRWETLARTALTPPKDAKTSLQEWAQGKAIGLPRYTVTQQEGPSHAPIFTVRVELPGYDHAEATAGNKRTAEQQAASLLLKQVTI